MRRFVPFAPLVQASDRNGTTYSGGGSDQCAGGCGTVFEIAGSDVLVSEPDASLASGAAGLALAIAAAVRGRRESRR